MNNFFTADYHFNHAGIINLADRPFDSVEEMNETIIENHNKTVKKGDSIYFLGDFIFGKDKQLIEFMKRLNGNFFMVPGNHDVSWWKRVVVHSAIRTNRIQFLDPIHIFRHSKRKFVLCHYPIEHWFGEHKKGWFHLHGHSHGNAVQRNNRFDVGVDVNNFYPIHLDVFLAMDYGRS